jgi:hypothetical protein
LYFVEEVLAGLVDDFDGVLVLGMEEVEQVGEQIDGAGDGVGVEVALGLVTAHGVASGAGAEAVGGVGIEESVGGDDEMRIVGREVHGGGFEVGKSILHAGVQTVGDFVADDGTEGGVGLFLLFTVADTAVVEVWAVADVALVLVGPADEAVVAVFGFH